MTGGAADADLSATMRLADRLAAVVWPEDFTRAYSRMRLMREYLRRSAHWARTLNVPENWPFFDIAECVDPTVHLDEQFAQRFEQRLIENGALFHHREYCLWALRFSALGAVRPDLPDPFEPLVQVYERGGSFGMEAGTINFVHGLVVSRHSIEKYLDPELRYDLSEEALARIDATWQADVAARIARVGRP
ncbi:hypothetical protein CS0771_73390 [Catellatospora sp. IY07-71]|uniref:hypothetical protein n=1 Tax=Catellatospora sp. IY07-71 TaxID=2728827 RepID=UPI001BB44AA4|nr:hypothetical protein [Catellatospora sp. IY07-71]BCJ77795.1 hypothetical protein CS0771_73390 [Catellatospora sp. IY07-71]